MALEIGDHHLAEIGRQAEAGYPEEVCGLLLGRCDGRDRLVLRILPCGNLERERAGDRYELDPAGQLRAEVEARREGLEPAAAGALHERLDRHARGDCRGGGAAGAEPRRPRAPDRGEAHQGPRERPRALSTSRQLRATPIHGP